MIHLFKTFDQLLAKSKNRQAPKQLAAVWAGEHHTLEAVIAAHREGYAQPILVGEGAEIRRLLGEMNIAEEYPIVEAATPEEAIEKTIALVHQGKADIIFKGLMQTATIMRAVVRKESGMSSQGLLSHLSLQEIPGHHKLVALTDCALLTYPTTEQKKAMIQNAADFMGKMGVETPKVAILGAVETVNPKMPETVEAAQLKEMQQKGEITGCIVEGPISYDLAMDPEAAGIKGYESPVAGDADILVVPNIQAGNILVKSLIFSAKSRSAGLIVGAKVPVIVTSRSSPVASKCTAIAVAAALE